MRLFFLLISLFISIASFSQDDRGYFVHWKIDPGDFVRNNAHTIFTKDEYKEIVSFGELVFVADIDLLRNEIVNLNYSREVEEIWHNDKLNDSLVNELVDVLIKRLKIDHVNYIFGPIKHDKIKYVLTISFDKRDLRILRRWK